MTTASPLDSTHTSASRALLNKVPAVTATFWLIKILSTTVGETVADFLAVQVGLGPAITDGIMMSLLAITLTAQLRVRQLVPWLYWLTVVLVSIVGTQITDFFTDTLGVPLAVSTTAFAVVLSVVFTLWWRRERTLAITAIDTPARERFYWGAILTTFALGTAGGDFATEALSLGFRNGALIFGGVILAVWALRRLRVLASVLAFWVAYVLTRPLGASLGDLLTQDRSYGGLGLGASLTSALFLAVILVLVAREQLNVTLYGVPTKVSPSPVPAAHDYAWTAAATVAILGVALVLTPTADAASTIAGTPSGTSAGTKTTSAGIEADATSPLGDLRPLAVIVDDVAAKVKANDIPGATSRVKDLEVSWDSSEAAMKPASPSDWHTMDSAIDAVLTALRAASPIKATCATALSSLQSTIETIDRKA